MDEFDFEEAADDADEVTGDSTPDWTSPPFLI